MSGMQVVPRCHNLSGSAPHTARKSVLCQHKRRPFQAHTALCAVVVHSRLYKSRLAQLKRDEPCAVHRLMASPQPTTIRVNDRLPVSRYLIAAKSLLLEVRPAQVSS